MDIGQGHHAKLERTVNCQAGKEKRKLKKGGSRVRTKEEQKLGQIKDGNQKQGPWMAENECAVEAQEECTEAPAENPARL